MQLETMPKSLRFLHRFRYEVELNLDLEFTPSGLRYLEWGLFDGTDVLGVCLVQLKLDFFQPVGDVFIVDTFDVNAPLMRVVGWGVGGFLGWVEGLGFAAEY